MARGSNAALQAGPLVPENEAVSPGRPQPPSTRTGLPSRKARMSSTISRK